MLTPALGASGISEHYDVIHSCTGGALPFRTFHVDVIRKARNFYDVLGLTPKASQAQVKGAYFKLSKKYHPDVNKSDDAQKRFAEISEAYETLGNRARRRVYDGGPRVGGAGIQSARRTHRADAEYTDFTRRTGEFKERPQAPMTGKTAKFDFDAFYKAHYGDVLHKTRNMKASHERHRERIEQIQRRRDRSDFPTTLVIAMAALAIVIFLRVV